ncbi:hypothetical protein [Halorarius litoreus]|uniref:hypothetical protein n=1 Tax=Halorarius litoreus TaxID=2962676 RepID=UPI0020CC3823|nr:hypothetical protein [Halorarius litoreus]
MAAVELSSALFGRERHSSLEIATASVILGALMFSLLWLSRVSQIVQLELHSVFIVGGMAVGGFAVVVAAVTAYRDSGLLNCWMLVFWPAAVFGAFGAAFDGIGSNGIETLVLSGAFWGTLVAVTVGTLAFAIGMSIRWAKSGKITL